MDLLTLIADAYATDLLRIEVLSCTTQAPNYDVYRLFAEK
jgi:hypothetical protein